MKAIPDGVVTRSDELSAGEKVQATDEGAIHFEGVASCCLGPVSFHRLLIVASSQNQTIVFDPIGSCKTVGFRVLSNGPTECLLVVQLERNGLVAGQRYAPGTDMNGFRCTEAGDQIVGLDCGALLNSGLAQ